jgi:signal transduction histidine kinase
MFAATVMLALLTIGFNAVLDSTLDNDAEALLQTRASAVLATLDPEQHIKVREMPDDSALDSQVWIYEGAKPLKQAPASPAVRRAAGTLTAGRRRTLEVPGTSVELLGVPVIEEGGRVGTVVVGVSLVPYQRTAERALIASLIFAALILLALAVSVRWLLSNALRPVARMTAEAAEWTEHDLDHRFGAGEPTDELSALAATFDRMLDRLAASLRREQDFSAEVSHELRTPLAHILAELELGLQREREVAQYQEAMASIQESATQMKRTLETLIAAARAESGLARGTSGVTEVLADVEKAWASAAAERGLELSVSRTAQAVKVGVEDRVLQQVLTPILENALRFARSIVTIDPERRADGVHIVVGDDGPGVLDQERERIFDPGVRGSQTDGRDPDPGAGLGLSLSRRLARAAGGDVTVVVRPRGATFDVRLPAA